MGTYPYNPTQGLRLRAYSYLRTFSTIQIPQYNQNCLSFTCVVDARWAFGDVTFHDVAQDGASKKSWWRARIIPGITLVLYLSMMGTWKRLEQIWLIVYTYTFPQLFSVSLAQQTKNLPRMTSLASMLSRAGLDNSTGQIKTLQAGPTWHLALK